jgi:hypothetical protein
MKTPSPLEEKSWSEKFSRSGYFIGAVLAHLIIFVLVATYTVFPAAKPPPDFAPVSFTPPATPPPVQPPHSNPDQPKVDLTAFAPAPKAPKAISGPGNFTIKPPTIDMTSDGATPGFDPTPKKIEVSPKGLSPDRTEQIKKFIEAHRTPEDIAHSDEDPRNIKTTFPVYLASYANGDWACNVHLTDGKIDSGSLPDLVTKINEWSHGNIKGEMMPTPLNIASQDLIDKKPPFIFFTGHKDFVLTDAEVQNLRDYLEMGGAIWGDNALAGRGSRFDVAFRREMKRVVGVNFTSVAEGDKMLSKWFPQEHLPKGMNYYAEPVEHMDIDGRLAVIYTPNDYSDLFFMHILPGDTQVSADQPDLKTQDPLFTSGMFWHNRHVFFRNFELSSCLAAQHLGMNIVGFMLVRFDNDLLLAP